MPKLRSIVPLTPAEAEVLNVTTKKELQALVKAAKCHLRNLGWDEAYYYIGRPTALRARSAIAKIERTLAEKP